MQELRDVVWAYWRTLYLYCAANQIEYTKKAGFGDILKKGSKHTYLSREGGERLLNWYEDIFREHKFTYEKTGIGQFFIFDRDVRLHIDTMLDTPSTNGCETVDDCVQLIETHFFAPVISRLQRRMDRNIINDMVPKAVTKAVDAVIAEKIKKGELSKVPKITNPGWQQASWNEQNADHQSDGFGQPFPKRFKGGKGSPKGDGKGNIKGDRFPVDRETGKRLTPEQLFQKKLYSWLPGWPRRDGAHCPYHCNGGKCRKGDTCSLSHACGFLVPNGKGKGKTPCQLYHPFYKHYEAVKNGTPVPGTPLSDVLYFDRSKHAVDQNAIDADCESIMSESSNGSWSDEDPLKGLRESIILPDVPMRSPALSVASFSEEEAEAMSSEWDHGCLLSPPLSSVDYEDDDDDPPDILDSLMPTLDFFKD